MRRLTPVFLVWMLAAFRLFAATFTVTNTGGYLGQIAVFTTGSAQRLAGPGGQPPSTYSFDASDYVTDPLELQFEPIVTTQVSDEMVQPGEPFIDQLVVGLSSASPSAEWRAFEDGQYLPIAATGRLYGPFAEIIEKLPQENRHTP